MADYGGSPRNATLCIPVRGDPPREVLLGFKKAGFGAGKYTGFGGKVELDETVIQAAIREMAEETGIQVSEQDMQPVGRLLFSFPAKPEWSQSVHLFLARTWEGAPQESREMIPTWFSVDEIPFERMWQDGAHWLPRILAGERIQAFFTFREDNETINSVETRSWDTTSD
jgi:8-oxo-dGTP diphosphatase